MNTYVKKNRWLLILIFIPFVFSCEKQQEKKEVLASDVKIKELITYISISFNIKEEVIKYDNRSSEFYVQNTVFRLPLPTIDSAYNLANEYKSKH